MARSDEIAVVEAAYRFDGTEAAWLEGLLDAAEPLFEGALGITAATLEFSPSSTRMGTWALRCNSELQNALKSVLERDDYQSVARQLLRPGPPVRTIRGMSTPEDHPTWQSVAKCGVRDGLGVLAVDANGSGVLIGTHSSRLLQPSRREIARWSRIASHLSAGLRIRRALASARDANSSSLDPFDGSEAVIGASGSVEHLGTEDAKRAQSELARAALAIDRARGTLRTTDATAALEAWRGLVSGRWSLIEHFDTDGRRFLVARRNDPDAPGSAELTREERQVIAYRVRGYPLKLIAYELGVPVGSVGRRLARGRAKLGFSTDAELVTSLSVATKR